MPEANDGREARVRTAALARHDRRLTPARGDIAASFLRGEIAAERYVDGVLHQVVVEVADVRRQPRPDAPLDTQLRFGQRFRVFDEEDGWAWGQGEADGYVGYVAASALHAALTAPTHRVEALRTFVYPAPDMKQPPLRAVTLGAHVSVAEPVGEFVRLADHGFVFARHLAPFEDLATDFVSVAERLVGVPYLWGGSSTAGIDCSGLIQLAAHCTGVALPRDTDLQEEAGDPLPYNESYASLSRGDVVFWKGHVGVMVDPQILLHANAYHMLVIAEPLRDVCGRSKVAVSSIRRII